MFAIPAIVEQTTDKTIVKMALHVSKRTWMLRLCQREEGASAGTG